MANLTQIKLPNNTTYDIKDSSALATMTFSGHTLQTVARGGASNNIDLGTFDALTATDLTAGNLVVNGAGRFTNGIIGDLTGNVTGNLTGTASSVTTTADTSNSLYLVGVTSGATSTLKHDTGVTMQGGTITATTFSGNATSATNAQYLTPKVLSSSTVTTQSGTFAFIDERDSAANSYVGIQVDREYTSGTNIKFQLFSGRAGLQYRQWNYSASTWVAAVPVLTSSNYNTYAPSLTGTGASGTWGIDISGNAATATGDSDGNTISSTYLKLSGGTMTGNIYFPNSYSIKTANSLGNQYSMITDAGNNLWIGANVSTGPHHSGTDGRLYLSTGWSTTNSSGNSTAYLSIPTLSGSTWSHVAHAILHDANYSSYCLPKTGGTLTGELIIEQSSTIANNTPSKIRFRTVQTDNNLTYDAAYIAVYDDHDTANNGTNMVIQSGGNMFIGSGESPSANYSNKTNDTGEAFYLTSDGNVYIEANAQTIANRLGFYLSTDHNIVPCKAGASTNNVGSIGTSTYRWANVYATNVNSNLVYANGASSGTAGGLALWGTSAANLYGIAMRTTANSGVHGDVSGGYAIYSYMTGDASSIANRGWILRDAFNSANVASVSCGGNAVFNGSVTVGGNAANTSGCRLVYNTTASSLDFVFV